MDEARALCALLSLTFLSVALGTVPDTWLHCAVLDGDGKYNVCWNVAEGEEDIVFKVEVETLGYVGFGLSPNGGMAGSDIVTGWIRGQEAFLQDRHGTGNLLPDIDASEDWLLIVGSRNNTHTSLVFRRKLESCDKDDMKIDGSTMRLIYAYSDKSPLSADAIPYHGILRGSKSVLLMQPKVPNPPSIDKSSLQYWEVLSPNFTLTSEHSTMYWCKIHNAPKLTEKSHIILVEPSIQRGNEGFVHHMLLYECVGGTPDEYDEHVDLIGHQCHRPNMPDAMKKCEGVFIAWGVGGEDMVLPNHVGLPLESTPPKYYMLEIHYDNPSLHDGISDQSGFKIYYTTELRQHDAGVMMIGSTISSRVFVPPWREEFIVAGHSNPDCLDPVMPETGIKGLGAFLHSHLLARRLKARHFRNNTELTPLALDSNYDFNYQEYRYYSEEVTILPGDQITVECTYNSSERNFTTFGGESTVEEMCLVFLLYYPRIERFASMSVPLLPVINTAVGANLNEADIWNGGMYEYFDKYDWNKADIPLIENSLRYSLHDSHCYLGNGDKNSVRSLVSYPPELKPYETNSTCVSQEHYSGSPPKNWKYFHLFICLFITYYILRESSE